MFTDIIKKYEKNSIIISILMLVLAIFLIVEPVTSAITAIYMFSIFAVVDGIMHIVSYCRTNVDSRLFNFEFAEGVFDILSGVLIFFSAKFLVQLLPVLIGIFIIIKSIIKMQLAFNIRTDIKSNWVLTLVFSIISLIIGIFILFNPMFGYITISIMGVFLVIYEILSLSESIYVLCKLK